jgi:tetratricopeptide (TPR) repeat protein
LVQQFQFGSRHRVKTLILFLASILSFIATDSYAADRERSVAEQTLADAQKLYDSGQYFKAARYAFAAIESDKSVQAEAYSWVTISLVQAQLPNAASYFFIKTLQSGKKSAVRRALGVSQSLLVHVGGDLLRKYMIRHTKYDDYDGNNKNAYLYNLGKEALLRGQEEKAIGYLNGIRSSSPLSAYALQLRGTAYAIRGNHEQALDDFKNCISRSGNTAGANRSSREADDLESRCQAGYARTLYQMQKFDDADLAYDQIAKASIVWPDVLFEQAWNAFARGEYNRTLGRLVSYKSPSLDFVFNSEVDVLRAQSYLALCLYSDANETINEFNANFSKLGEKVKHIVEANGGNLGAFYELGKSALKSSIYTKNETHKMANRFVRSPYFQNLVKTERDLAREKGGIRFFDSAQPGMEQKPDRGFPGFLDKVLDWRLESIRALGGAFVKNSLMDYHQALISDFEKMAFIKLEMLKRAKDFLVYKKHNVASRLRGNVEPSRKGYQYYWGFNGEFWTDELGDYVFGLESECKN